MRTPPRPTFGCFGYVPPRDAIHRVNRTMNPLHAKRPSRLPATSVRRGAAGGRLVAVAAALLLIAGTLAMAASPCLAQAPLKLRVLSYNIHHGEGVDGKLDLERIAGVINGVRPDLVSLQEVDRNTQRNGRVDQPAVLSKLTGMKVVFERNIDFEGGQYGNAVLSRFPIVESKNHHLPCLNDGEQRGALVVKVEVGQAKAPLIFVATHLDHRRDDAERLKSAEYINDLAVAWKHPAILAGDLNATPESEVLKVFVKQWQRANREVMPTVPVAKPRVQIDYVLVRSPGTEGQTPPDASQWKVLHVEVLDEAVASDHRAIFAELELRPAANNTAGKR